MQRLELLLRREIKLPDGRWFYIAKVMPDPQGRRCRRPPSAERP